MEQPDSLILEFQNGNEQAFSKIYSMYSKAIYGIIHTIVKDEGMSEEVLQDVFVKIWNNASSYNSSKGRFFTWMLNIARNSAIDKTRSKEFKNSQQNLSTENFVDIFKGSDSLNRSTNAIGIRKFIEALEPLCIRVIELLFFQGFTQADAAKEMDIPVGTVKTRARTCIRDLRNIVLGPTK